MDNIEALSKEYIGPVMMACRKRAGLSQETLAELLFCSRSLISKVEQKRQIPKFAFVMSWLDATNSKDVAVAFFLGEKSARWIINKLQQEGYWEGETNSMNNKYLKETILSSK